MAFRGSFLPVHASLARSTSVPGQCEKDDGTRRRVVCGGDAAAVGLDDALANREPQAGAAHLRGVEGLEELAPLLRGKPRPVVADGDLAVRAASAGGWNIPGSEGRGRRDSSPAWLYFPDPAINWAWETARPCYFPK